jgi:hypothetical protein
MCPPAQEAMQSHAKGKAAQATFLSPLSMIHSTLTRGVV